MTLSEADYRKLVLLEWEDEHYMYDALLETIVHKSGKFGWKIKDYKFTGFFDLT